MKNPRVLLTSSVRLPDKTLMELSRSAIVAHLNLILNSGSLSQTMWNGEYTSVRSSSGTTRVSPPTIAPLQPGKTYILTLRSLAGEIWTRSSTADSVGRVWYDIPDGDWFFSQLESSL